MDKLLTPQELAELLKIPLDWVYRYWEEKLPFAVKFGRHLRFSEVGLNKFLEEEYARKRVPKGQDSVDKVLLPRDGVPDISENGEEDRSEETLEYVSGADGRRDV